MDSHAHISRLPWGAIWARDPMFALLLISWPRLTIWWTMLLRVLSLISDYWYRVYLHSILLSTMKILYSAVSKVGVRHFMTYENLSIVYPGQSLPSTWTSNQSSTYMLRKLWSESDVSEKVVFTMSCWILTVPLPAINIDYNWFIWAAHYEKNSQNTSIIKLSFFPATLKSQKS